MILLVVNDAEFCTFVVVLVTAVLLTEFSLGSASSVVFCQ